MNPPYGGGWLRLGGSSGPHAWTGARVLAALQRIGLLAHSAAVRRSATVNPLLAARLESPAPPVVTTHHGVFDEKRRRILAETARHAHIVAISHDQARSARGIPIAAVIHHGIDLDLYRSGRGDAGHLLFLGRMSPDKGAHIALRIAHRAGLPLVLVGKMREPGEVAYFEEAVRPLLAACDNVVIEPPLEQRLELLRGASALINPISWPEPFGLVMIEALASGTPVLAFGNGAAPEIVDHGRTGFLASDEDGLAAVVARIPEIERTACRAAAERRFSMERMTRDYERLFRSVLSTGPSTPRRHTSIERLHRAVPPRSDEQLRDVSP